MPPHFFLCAAVLMLFGCEGSDPPTGRIEGPSRDGVRRAATDRALHAARRDLDERSEAALDAGRRILRGQLLTQTTQRMPEKRQGTIVGLLLFHDGQDFLGPGRCLPSGQVFSQATQRTAERRQGNVVFRLSHGRDDLPRDRQDFFSGQFLSQAT